MWGVTRPDHEPGTVFEQCISNAREPLKSGLAAATDAVVDAAELYEKAADAKQLHVVQQTSSIGAVSASDMTKVYTDRMVPADAPGRMIYAHIYGLSDGRCPMCLHGRVRTLDHFLPKSLFPLLSVVPLNLVPCCNDCNKAKQNKVPTSAEAVTMHPYFDAFDDDPWLTAEVLETHPAAFRFYVSPPPSWDAVTILRAEKHFDTFGLAELYAVQAGRELSGVSKYIAGLHGSNGNQGVKEHVTEMAVSRGQPHLNCWQAAMYSAMSQSPWFCSEGFW
jgi:hypothetical protein